MKRLKIIFFSLITVLTLFLTINNVSANSNDYYQAGGSWVDGGDYLYFDFGMSPYQPVMQQAYDFHDVLYMDRFAHSGTNKTYYIDLPLFYEKVEIYRGEDFDGGWYDVTDYLDSNKLEYYVGNGWAEMWFHPYDFYEMETEYIGVRVTVPTVNATPVLDGETAFVTNVDNPKTLNQILSHVYAYDDEDGDLTHAIVVEQDNYTSNRFTLGTYTIKLSVTDSNDNRAEMTIHVMVKDVVAPVITGQQSYTHSMTNRLNINTIRNNLTVTDNYDTNLTIVIDSNNYHNNFDKLGTYAIVFSSTDSSGNKGSYTVNVTVIDDVKPTISGPTTIVKNQTETLTTNQIQEQLTANDNVDGNITNKIQIESNTYGGNGHKVGTYEIVFSVTDNAGNKTIHTVAVTVKDNIPPVFYVDNYFITVSQSIALTKQDIIDLLTATGQITVNAQTTIMTLNDTYTGNEETVGLYAMSFRILSQNGNEHEESVVIRVLDDHTEDNIILNPTQTNGFVKVISSIWSFITTIFTWLWSVLVWIVKSIYGLFV